MTHVPTRTSVAYFSMEICLEQAIPTYSGGLGVLAGDTLRSAADLAVPVVAVTLLHRKGYFEQHLDASGQQTETPVHWKPEEVLERVDAWTTVTLEEREVRVTAWKYVVKGVRGHEVPVYLLDTNVPENSEWDRTLTDTLYGGDDHYRLCQEIVLGMGGAALLQEIGYQNGTIYHLNEGHSALLTLQLLEKQLVGRPAFELEDADFEAVRSRCVFTTHTPVPAGHDKFPLEMVRKVLGDTRVSLLESSGGIHEGMLNMTHLALHLTRFVNGVAMRHGEVSRGMFPEYPIDSITNGVHATTWTGPAFAALFDRRIPEWRHDNLYLRYAVSIPLQEIREAHAASKAALLEEIERRTGERLDPGVMTIGFARRATPYKRADLIFSDLDRLTAIARSVGKIQIVFGGKAHPHDGGGKELIRRIFAAREKLGDLVKIVYVENYEMALAYKMVAGVDLWLNNPMKPLEASGTSGMKAAMNGVPSFSVLDGWWVEGHVEGVTGWSIGGPELEADPTRDAVDLYIKLERVILPLFYGLPFAYAEVMRSAIALNGSFFNTQRMVGQYVHNAYFPNGASNASPAEAIALI
ncbi:MAG: alpha-glucan family phosphorylase [Gemmatimonadaceae bacterium]|nr:alpha-glucan family phosphorylase [Gemmatimonadaceae bacterium]NUP71395.1 alpha-glucan family phosphorylase [Gemmatimonadaceae bacterium]NUR32897.1 alpha-glucan family phosphorylase [Gemmatimonadaceae bacterium]NUS33692.1 alpha-glucan family phosphorylase [Gemmatimonadaceae bacterium]NUS48375.1 alpha-glucan family phosphorylase [Gemmatimonadaceae bacterium]